MKKLLTSLLCVVMVVCFMPSMAWAADGDVAFIGDAGYSTVQAAVYEAAKNTTGTPVTINVTADSTEDVNIPAQANIVLDFAAGVTLTNNGDHTITNNGTLTITGTGTVDNVTHAKGALNNKGTVTLEGCTFTRSAETGQSPSASGGNSWYVIHNSGTIQDIKEGVTVTSTGKFSSLICSCGKADNHAKIEKISGGTFENNFVVLKNDEYSDIGEISGGRFHAGSTATGTSVLLNYGVIGNISGGQFVNDGETTVIRCANWPASAADPIVGTAKITGGSFSVAGDGTVLLANNGESAGTVMPEIVIEGGSFTGAVSKVDGATLEISAGTFTQDVKGFVTADKTSVKVKAPAGEEAYYVGTKEEVATAIKDKLVKDAEVTVQQGELELKGVVDGVTVKNEGDGTVSVNDTPVVAGTPVETYTPVYIPPTTQTPTIEADENATVTLSDYGTKATIKVADGYELVDVTVNGESKGKVDTLTGLKTGDKVVVTTKKIEEPIDPAAEAARIKAGVENTTLKIYSSKGDGYIKLNWKKSKGFKVDGYEVYRGKTKSSMKKYDTTKKNSYKNAKYLKKGNRYYYKVRGYRMVGDEKVYTKWSKTIYRIAK